MPWIAPVVGAGVGLMGDLFSQSGQQATNAMNMALMQQNENWQTQMSNTSMQRRVTDLQAAGLNPMLAVNTPGAPMPAFQQPTMQNPNAAFGQLGQQTTSAMQSATIPAQIKNLNADTAFKQGPQTELTGNQAALTKTQDKVQQTVNDVLMPAQAQAARAAAQLDDSSRARIEQQINSGDIAAQVKLLGQQTTLAGAQTQLAQVDALMDKMSAIEKQYAMPFVIKELGVQLQTSMLKIPELNATANYFETWAGQHLRLQNQIESGIGTATDLFKAFSPFGGGGRGSGGVNNTPGFSLGAGSPNWQPPQQ